MQKSRAYLKYFSFDRYNDHNVNKFLNNNVKPSQNSNVTPSRDKYVITFPAKAVKMLLSRIANRSDIYLIQYTGFT